MSKIRILFHVGYPKAASTALQESLVSLRLAYKNAGLIYPNALVSSSTSKHEELFRLLRFGKLNQVYRLLKDEIDCCTNRHTVFLSTESVVNYFGIVSDASWVALFQVLKRLGSLHLVLVRRETNSLLKSYYKQAVVNQNSSTLDFYSTPFLMDDFAKLPAIKSLLDFDAVIQKLKRLSCAPVRVFDYGPNVVRDVVSWAIQDEVSVGVPTLSNVSLQAEEVELIRQLNATCPALEERNAWFRLLSKCCALGNRTAMILASRSQDWDLLRLNADWLQSVRTGENPLLSVNEDNLLSLVQRAHHCLLGYQERERRLHKKCDNNYLAMVLKPMYSADLKNCVRNRLVQVLSSTVNQKHGQGLVEARRLELAPFMPVEFVGWGDWEQNPFNNRSWQWRLNWLSFLPQLFAYHSASKNDMALNLARDGVQSWLDSYLLTDMTCSFEFIWHDHATALRAEQLVFFVYYVLLYAPEWGDNNAYFVAYMQHSLFVHGEWLAKDSFYSHNTNHGLEQARVLLLLGTVFDGGQALEWQRIALQRIGSELSFSFTVEGVHVENSPAYHIFVFKVFMGIFEDYSADVLGDLAERFERFSAKALSYITHILRPDGLLPPIGDTEQLSTSDAYRKIFGGTPEYQNLLYALSLGKQGVRPTTVNRVYPESGYAIFRDLWPSVNNYRKAFHLIVKAGCSSRYHHQEDEGHVCLYAGGEDWLIDSGLYNYINADPVRKYMRGRVGHNVPLISHAKYDKAFEHRLRAWEITDYSESRPTPFVTMRLAVLQPVVHVRRVLLDATARVVEVEDIITADDCQKRNVTLQWHMPKDKKITIESDNVVVTSRKGSRLRIMFEGDTPDKLAVFKGCSGDRVFSCISYKANQLEPSQLLRVFFKERDGVRVITRFVFELV